MQTLPDMGGTVQTANLAAPFVGDIGGLPDQWAHNPGQLTGPELGGYASSRFSTDWSTTGPLWAASAALPVTTPGRAAYGNGVICILNVAAGSNTLMRSTDFGKSFVLVTMPFASNEWKSICTNGRGTWLAVCGNNVVSSLAVVSFDNAVTWKQSNIPTTGFWYIAQYGGGVFLIINATTTVAYTSPDAVTWALSSALPSTQTWRGAAYCNNTWVAVGNLTTPIVSLDGGVNWSNASTTAAASVIPPLVLNGRFVLLTNTGFWESVDGKSWTSHTSPAFGAANWALPAGAGDGLVVVAPNGGFAQMAISQDAITYGTTTTFLPSPLSWSIYYLDLGLWFAFSGSSTAIGVSLRLSPNGPMQQDTSR